ncbi:MAG: cell filamentation protein Fic [Legionellales bacterium]|nr:cell filamentation protein Fic [Legionellales bacterium]|tara:strand:- start:85525 stop:87054 length:1530 start_codon:yes stop_codon:yes gene_type:complete
MAQTDRIAAALERVKAVADKYHSHIVPTVDIDRQDREILVRTHWLEEITKGWYMLTRPDLAAGDSAAWYANFWDFIRVYLQQRYDNRYCLSAEASLELYSGNMAMPRQVIAIVPEGGTLLNLPYDTSLMIYADPKNIPDEKIEYDGLQVMSLPYALCKAAPTYFRNNAENAEIAMRSVRSSSEISRVIIENDFRRAADRIVGAYDFLGMENYAKDIETTINAIGLTVNKTNPFDMKMPVLSSVKERSPYAARIRLLWQKYREEIIHKFPEAKGLPKQKGKYLAAVDKLYEYDAYNSLSIEGYQVTPALIHRVRNNHWNPEQNQFDNDQRNALAARGYYDAFQQVKETLADILDGKNPGECIEQDLSLWYQQLFSPSVKANIVSAGDLAGYRNSKVYIRNSRHTPPTNEVVIDCMEAFFDCLSNEESAAVRAVLGHYIFVFIHPYMDGNGRIARFILNAMLASGGYPWTIVQVSRRKQYIDSLEYTHTENSIAKFCQFIIEEMAASEQYS